MEWKITPCSHGGYTASFGMQHDGGEKVSAIGVTLPAFIVYVSVHFDTLRQAKAYIRKNPEPLKK